MLSGIVQKLAGLSSLSWLQMLPWAMVGVGAAVGGAGALGWHEGAKVTASDYEAQKSKAAADGAAATFASIEHALTIGQTILADAKDFVSEINLTRERRVQIVQKVTADARANISAACVVPPVTHDLRQQQVDESATVLAKDIP